MLLGIDVGGTFTDAVVLDNGRVVAFAKTPTDHSALLASITASISKVLERVSSSSIKRISLSTTIVTNTLIEEKEDKAALFLIPGPGVNISSLVPVKPVILSGYTDHTGKMKLDIDENEIVSSAIRVRESSKDVKVAAVAGKFAIRNPKLEHTVKDIVKQNLKTDHITLGSEVAGTLNFLRRANSAYYNAAVWRTFKNFAEQMKKSLEQIGLDAPVYILKADGGTMLLDTALELPVEAIFTGPAASVLGIIALTDVSEEAKVSIDIGGTSSDIAIWQNKVPLFSPNGAKVNKYPTAVRSFWLNSIGVGGDSYVRREDGELKIGPMRNGPAMAAGGNYPTVFDAVRYLDKSDYGEKDLAEKAMKIIALEGQTLTEAAEEVVNKSAEIIVNSILEMIEEKQQRPVYKVEDIVKEEKFEIKEVVGIGGAANGLVEKVAEKLSVKAVLPVYGMLANAIGAASSKPTTYITLRADTNQDVYTVPELGIKEKLPQRPFLAKDAIKLAYKHLEERALKSGIEVSPDEEIEEVYLEEFNVIKGFSTMGKIISLKLQIKSGVLMKIERAEN
ncbi:hydantoinase/oxoprolinase family protein [Selenomonadales bacterium OttesenSCG-928-I06]|nr:hydantoinase/oxoprolinase family protein [Selenomonadales bacterium OttesenSCG-928-I06]